MVSVMLISVLNIKVTCEWHKAIKLNYKNTCTHVIVVLRVPRTIHENAQRWRNMADCASVSWIAVIWHHTQGRKWIRLSADRYSVWTRKKTTLFLAIISVTVQMQLNSVSYIEKHVLTYLWWPSRSELVFTTYWGRNLHVVVYNK